MKNRSFLAVALCAISLALIPALSQAGHDGKTGHGQDHHGMQGHASQLMYLEKMADGYHVTDEQRAKIRALADKFRPDVRNYGDQLRQSKRDIRAQMKADAPDAAIIRSAAETEGKAMGELMVIQAQIRMAMNSIMPAEQRAQFWKYHEKSDANRGTKHCKMCNMRGMKGMKGAHGKHDAADKDDVPETKGQDGEHSKPVPDPEAAQL